MKLLFQKLCQSKEDWDEELSPDMKERYDKWMSELRKVGSIRIPRCYFRENDHTPVSIELHGFSDASSYAYAAVVYLRVELESSVKSVLVASKTREAPLGGLTIPRLDLLGAVILARLVKHVEGALSGTLRIDRVRCWVDSTAVLYWIIGEKKQWKQFVQNRILEIRSLVAPSCWSYCPTSVNPADLPSRGMKASDLAESDEWWNGPMFLSLPEQQWPARPDTSLIEESVLSENKGELKKEAVQVSANLVSESEEKTSLSECIDLERFSSKKKLFRVTAYVLRFVSRLKEKIRNTRNIQNSPDQSLSVREVEAAELLWIREVQRSIAYGDKFSQQKLSLGLFLDDKGIYRCRGRLENSALPYQAKYPALLPSKHHLTSLIVQECHGNVKHRGVKDTLTELRSRYWIPKGRQMVKTLLRKCTVCSKLQGRPYSAPAVPDLPGFRVEDSYPFANTGVDFAGPLYVKNVFGGESKMHKVYIVLYTCASTRAVHLDLVPSLDAQSFIRSLKRFFARRGVNQLFISDNAKTFKSQEVQLLVNDLGIDWKFNLPWAPWWGGFFERMVRCTKGCLKKTLGSARLTYEELLTVLTEVEGVLNSRPLTYVCGDDIEEPLTPSYLMIGRRLLSRNPKTAPGGGSCASSVTEIARRAKYLKSLLDHFWNRWQKEYLTELRQFHQYAVSNKNRGACPQKESSVKEGDVVIVKDEKRPRNTWKMGRVKKLVKGRDGKIRGAVVETVADNQNRRIEIYSRAVQHLVPVECKEQGTFQQSQQGAGEKRTRRQAAIMSDIRRQCLR